MSDRGKVRVAVVFGGRNSEHDVSCASAASILSHLDRTRYEVVPVKIETDGTWIVGVDAPEALRTDGARALADFSETFGSAKVAALHGIPQAFDRLADVDVVFPALHGRYGEDGSLQSLLEFFGLPFVGNGILSSAIGMDKEYTKKLLAGAGLAVADGVVLRTGRTLLSEDERTRLGLPVFVKPARSGSSVGVSRVDSWESLPAAIASARADDSKVLVEQTLHGREIDVGVLELPDGRIEAGPPLEIRLAPHQSVFDYQAKYTDGGAVFDIPARLDAETTATLRATALRVFELLGCAGLLRVDFFLSPDGTPVVNEVNTFPGFTVNSQFPQMWAEAGLGYADLLDILIETALRREERRDAPAR